MMIAFDTAVAPPDPRPPAEIPPNEPVIPPSEDPMRPSIPEELPQPDADPSPNNNPPAEMRTSERGGRTQAISAGLEETRFGDWEANGKCVDF